MTPNFETSTGVKLSYLRFISDSAPGFMLFLLLTFIWRNRPVPLDLNTPESRVLVAALVFMLATPIGLAINAVSYFLLGETQAAINRICFLSQWWPAAETRRTLFIKKAAEHFEFSAADWAERTDVYEEIIESFRPDLTVRLEHLRGLKRFARCIGFLALIWFAVQGMGWWANLIVVGWLMGVTLYGTGRNWGWMPKRELLFVLIGTGGVLAAIFALVILHIQCGRYALLPIATVAVGVSALLVAGMTDFYQRGTVALYLHIECPLGVRDDLHEIRDALSESARRLRS